MRKRILWAAFLTLTVFPVIGWAILYFFRDNPIQVILRSNQSIWIQLISGGLLGIVLGFGAKYLVSQPFLVETEKKYARIISNLRLKEWQIIFISLCAGFGEELLFRGALQPLMGIWITAIIFVAIHGYLDPRNWKMSIYGVYMTLVIAGLGYYTEFAGIYGACVAHAAIDYVLFKHLTRAVKTPENQHFDTLEEHGEIESKSSF